MKILSIEEIAQPECRLPFVNNRTVYLPRQRLLAAINFSDDGRDSRLFLVNADTLETEAISIPDAQHGAYGFVRGSDDRLYMGFFGGRIYSFDLASRSFRKVADPFPGSDKLTWGGFASRDGAIYMGVYPTGSFTEINIRTGEARIHHPLGGDIQGVYARDFVELPDGRIFLILMGARPTVLIYNPDSGNFDFRLDIEDADKQIAGPGSLCLLDERRVIYSSKSSLRTFDFVKGEWDADFVKEIPEPLAWISREGEDFLCPGGHGANLYLVRKGVLSSISIGLERGNRISGGVHQTDPGIFVALGDNGQAVKFSLENGPMQTRQVPNTTRCGMNLHLLRKEPKGSRMVGSHFINSQIFRADMDSGKTESSLDKVVTTGGQITNATFLDDTVYLGIYGQAIVQAYDMNKPFVFGENPRFLCKAGFEQNRPVGMSNDGERIYMATRAGYTLLGGAICVIDPKTGGCEVYRDFVPHQNPVSMGDLGDGRLIGTTQIFGDQGSCTPVAKHAVIYVWDCKTRSTVHMSAPWECPSLTPNDLSPSGLMIGFEKGRYFLFDARTYESAVRPWKESGTVSGLFLDDQYFLAALASEKPGWSRLVLLDVASGKTGEVGEVESVRLYQNLGNGEILASIGNCRIGKLKLDLSPGF